MKKKFVIPRFSDLLDIFFYMLDHTFDNFFNVSVVLQTT